jgi:hypothetical protein
MLLESNTSQLRDLVLLYNEVCKKDFFSDLNPLGCLENTFSMAWSFHDFWSD